MEHTSIAAEARTGTGKGNSRSLRRENKIAGIVYGLKKEPTKISLTPRSLKDAISGPYRSNQIIDLKIGTDTRTVLLQDWLVHPVSRSFIHVDFLEIDPTSVVTRQVPVEYTGKPEGVALGGRLDILRKKVKLSGNPELLPQGIKIEIGAMQLGDKKYISDMVLPEGISTKEDPKQPMAAIFISKGKLAALDGEEEDKAAAPADAAEKK